jgi:pimeloyl-ACP methyl ester carboxylesterase
MARSAISLLSTLAVAAVACSSSGTSSDGPAAITPIAADDAGAEQLDAGDAATPVDATAAPPPGSGGKGGLTCTSRVDVAGRSICTAKIGSVEVRILEPMGGSGPMRLGLYLHGDGAAAHKSGSVFKPMIAWADAQHGLGVSFLAPNGCAWWQAPTHDCTSQQTDPDLAGANAAALVTAIDAVMKAFDVRTDGMRYYGASGGSIFLTDEWLPLQAGTYPGVFAVMCGGDASARPYAWNASDAALRAKNPLWFTYGDKDFLLTDEQAAVAAFKGKGFAVTEKVLPNLGHCEFDAHGEAIGIWSQNP